MKTNWVEIILALAGAVALVAVASAIPIMLWKSGGCIHGHVQINTDEVRGCVPAENWERHE